jgi:hypothetical protein
MTAIIAATITSNKKSAKWNFEIEMPIILWHLHKREETQWVAELDSYYPATINLYLDSPPTIPKPDIETAPLRWHFHPSIPKESFAFTQIRFEYPIGTAPREAVVIRPSGSESYRDPRHLEIMTTLVDLLVQGERCGVHIP